MAQKQGCNETCEDYPVRNTCEMCTYCRYCPPTNIYRQKPQRGGRREGAGRPRSDRNIPVTVRLSKDAVDKLNKLTSNKSEYIDSLILEQ